MSATLEGQMNIVAILPVTALACIGKLLLVGRGRLLTIYDIPSGTVIAEEIVKTLQTIHGVVLIGSSNDGRYVRHSVLVYGGRKVVLTSLSLSRENDQLVAHLCIESYTCLADWILIAKQGLSSTCGFLLTSYNSLIEVGPSQAAEKLETSVINSSLCTFLYSGDFVQISEDDFIICSGTAFGEVLTWMLRRHHRDGEWQAYPWREYQGHNGSIFGISISATFEIDGIHRRVVASCSDDRTIRVWNLSEIEDADTSRYIANPAQDPKSYTVSKDSLAVTWAHLSRIWHVDFCGLQASTEASLPLVSTGEDGQTQIWSMDVAKLFRSSKSPANGICFLRADRFHTGKNIWARCYSIDDLVCDFYSGGADGQIVRRFYEKNMAFTAPFHDTTIKFKADQLQSKYNPSCPNPREAMSLGLKSYVLFNTNELLATTNTGLIVHAVLDSAEPTANVVAQSLNGTSYILAPQGIENHGFFAAPDTRELFAINIDNFEIINICSLGTAKISSINVAWFGENNDLQGGNALLAISYHGTERLQLCWLKIRQNFVQHISSTYIGLPDTFEVCSVCYVSQCAVLLCGSRAGAVTAYANIGASDATSPIFSCRRSTHDKDTVTSITALDACGHFLTTGRDGRYNVLKVSVSQGEIALELVHRSSLPFGPNIEGARIVQYADQSTNLLFYGFRSKDFVVWNETLHTEVLAIDCGGAHRSWAFWQTELEGLDMAFAWTQAGTFHYHRQDRPQHQIIQAGGHGREIKAVAMHQLEEHKWLIATGSEDTDIRLFIYDPSITGSSCLRCISILRKHTTGIQGLQFSDDGKILISSGGIEEMYAWHLTTVPLLTQGVVFAASLPRADNLSDARIMSFSLMHSTSNDSQCSTFLIAAAFSNGSAKLISYTSRGETGEFSVLTETKYGSICLTQACFLPEPVASSSGLPSTLFAATNGNIMTQRYLRGSVNQSTDTIPTVSRQHRIHQSSITTVQVVSLSAKYDLFITGSDDGALAFTLSLPTGHVGDSRSSARTLIIPEAHAAALTALVVIEPLSEGEDLENLKSLIVVTAGNDQRLQLWELQVTLSALSGDLLAADFANVLSMRRGQERYTNVADVSDMVLVPSTKSSRSINVLVAGIGIEVVEVDLSL